MTRANRAGPTPPGARVVLRRSGFLTAVLLVLCAAQALLAPAVSAHNVLISSTPAADSVLAAAPASIVLVFDQNVEPTYAKVAVTVAGHDPVEITPTVNGPTSPRIWAPPDCPTTHRPTLRWPGGWGTASCPPTATRSPGSSTSPSARRQPRPAPPRPAMPGPRPR